MWGIWAFLMYFLMLRFLEVIYILGWCTIFILYLGLLRLSSRKFKCSWNFANEICKTAHVEVNLRFSREERLDDSASPTVHFCQKEVVVNVRLLPLLSPQAASMLEKVRHLKTGLLLSDTYPRSSLSFRFLEQGHWNLAQEIAYCCRRQRRLYCW